MSKHQIPDRPGQFWYNYADSWITRTFMIGGDGTLLVNIGGYWLSAQEHYLGILGPEARVEDAQLRTRVEKRIEELETDRYYNNAKWVVIEELRLLLGLES